MEEETRKKVLCQNTADRNMKSDNQVKILQLMDALHECGGTLESLAGLCSVLRLGFESPNFCDNTEAADCMLIMEYLLNVIKKEQIDAVLTRYEQPSEALQKEGAES